MISNKTKKFIWVIAMMGVLVGSAIAKNYRIEFVKPGYFSANITSWMHYQQSDNEDSFVYEIDDSRKLTVGMYYGNDILESNKDFIRSLRKPEKQKVIIDEINKKTELKGGTVEVQKGSIGFKKIGRLTFFNFISNIKEKNPKNIEYYVAVHKGRALTMWVIYPGDILDSENKALVKNFLERLVFEIP